MDPFLGQIILFAGNFAPKGWALCNGQLLPISSNSALFAILGTTYGGDGRTTFGLPDLSGRTPIGAGQGPGLSARALGERGGTETVTLLTSNMPAHTHLAMASNSATSDSPEGGFWAPASQGGNPISAFGSQGSVAMNSQAVSVAGGSVPHSNMQPFLAMNYIIATQGVFPVRP